MLSILHSYFDSSTKLNYFSDLYPAKILDSFSKSVLSVYIQLKFSSINKCSYNN